MSVSNVLFLAQRIPYPPTKGEKIRSWQVLRHLSRHFDVHLGCLVDDPEDWQHRDAVRAVCADAHFARLDRRRARLACLRGLLSGEPLSVAFFRDAGLARWVEGVLGRVRPEAVLVSSSNMAPYVLGRLGGARARVTDLVDVDSEKWREYAATARGPMRWVYRREWRRMAGLERRIGQVFDHCTFVSDAEAALFARVAPDARAGVHAVSNGVDHAYFDPALEFAAPYDTNRPNFVFTGTMDYPPNVDAVLWFATEILPIIHGRLPGARFHIVGASPDQAVRRLAEADGVHVTGRVADVRPYIAHATACVAPMRIARGIQNKVLEAMALARPVVVTPQALEGIAAVAGREVVLADDAPGIAAACCALTEGGEGGAIGQAARRRVLADFVWAERLRGFDPLLAPALAAATGRAGTRSELHA